MSQGKIVEIHRHFSLQAMSQDDPEVQAWIGEAFRAIGPYTRGRGIPASGLNFHEEKILLPEIIGAEPNDLHFRAKVQQLYYEFLTRVPKGGLKLQVGLQDPSRPLYTLEKDKNGNPTETIDRNSINMPIDVRDYITYRHALQSPEVAKDEAEANKLYGKNFYFVDHEIVAKTASTINQLEDKAATLYFKFKDDPIKLDQILGMMGVNTYGMTKNAKVIKLKSFTQKADKEKLQKFIDIAQDEDLALKYIITSLIGAQFFRQVGTNILYEESGQKVGDNLEDAVLYFKNVKNSRENLMLMQQYEARFKNRTVSMPSKEKAEKQEIEEEEIKGPVIEASGTIFTPILKEKA